MKRRLLIALSILALALTLILSACTCNEDITINGTEAEVNGLRLTKITSGWMISTTTDSTKSSYDIPKEYDGFPITGIHSDAFRNCKSLTSITIPDNITYVGSRAFSGCSNLKEVYIKSASAQIEASAFADCPVKYARVPSSQIAVLPKTTLRDVDLVGGNVPESAFQGFEILTTIAIVGDVTFDPMALNGCTAYAFKIPPSKIDSFPLKHKVYNLVISPSLENEPSLTIHNAAFVDYTILQNITFENGYTYDIKENAFAGCIATGYEISADLIAHLPTNVKKLTVTAGEIKYHGTTSNLGIEMLIIMPTVSRVESGAFREVTSLKSLSFISSTTVIEDYTFYGCTSLNRIDIGSSVTTIENLAFAGCTSIEEITLGGNLEEVQKNAFKDCTALKIVRLEGNLKTLGEGVFENCSEITNVSIGSSLRTLPSSVFSGCNSISSFVVSEDNKILKSINFSLYSKDGKALIRYATNSEATDLTIPDGVTTIKSGAFLGEAYLQRIILPDSVTVIEESAFEGCAKLISIKLPSKLEVIEKSVFKDCVSLGSIVIPKSVKIISENAFYGCTALLHLTIGEGVLEIQKNAFYDCNTLVSVIIPENVEIMGETVFGSCENLTLISCEEKEQPETWHQRWMRGNNAEVVWGFESQSGGI